MIKLKTDYKWLFPLLLVILGGVAFAYHQLKQKPTLKIGMKRQHFSEQFL